MCWVLLLTTSLSKEHDPQYKADSASPRNPLELSASHSWAGSVETTWDRCSFIVFGPHRGPKTDPTSCKRWRLAGHQPILHGRRLNGQYAPRRRTYWTKPKRWSRKHMRQLGVQSRSVFLCYPTAQSLGALSGEVVKSCKSYDTNTAIASEDNRRGPDYLSKLLVWAGTLLS